MNSLLSDMIDKFVLVYLDDICIFSKNMEDHKKHVQMVLDRFAQEKLVVNKKKCHIAKNKLSFLGFEVSKNGISPSPTKVAAVQNWPKPTNVQEVRQFIGLSQHYRRFIPGFSSIAAPLTELTSGTGAKKRAVVWNPQCETSFNKIKQLLTSAPVLQMPDLSKPFVIETDSSDYGVGAVLLQPALDRQSSGTLSRPYGNYSTWHPVAFESKKLSQEEQKFPAQERELIAVVHALRTWRCFIEGCPAGYTVYCDHNPLVYFKNKLNPSSRLVRWISELELYAPDIQYKPGVDNALSRIPVVDNDSNFGTSGSKQNDSVKTMEPEYLYSLKHLPLTTRQDWSLLYLDGSYGKVNDQELKEHLIKEKPNFSCKLNSVYKTIKYIGKNNIEVTKDVLFVPFANRADLVSKHHEGTGHIGVKKLYAIFRDRYWWPRMRSDMDEWIKTCPWCQLNSRKPTAHPEEMHPLPIPHAFERWHLDFVGQLPDTIKGNKWLITAVDYATNWPIAKAMPVASKEAVANFIYEEIVVRFGCPIEIVTDRGSNFCSGLVEEYLKRIGTNHKLTSAFHPRTNSKVERFNGTIKNMLRKYVQGAINRWDEFVEVALWAVRVTTNASTGYSPYFLVYGREPKLPGDATIPFISQESFADPRTIADITARELSDLGQHRAAAEAKLKAVSQKDKERWDAHIKPVSYEVGDMVMLTHEDSFGLEPQFKGPFMVIQVFDNGTCRLETIEGRKLDSLVHKERLMHAKGNKPESTWYNPTVSRRTVKAITGSRSGRGGGECSRNPPALVESSGDSTIHNKSTQAFPYYDFGNEIVEVPTALPSGRVIPTVATAIPKKSKDMVTAATEVVEIEKIPAVTDDNNNEDSAMSAPEDESMVEVVARTTATDPAQAAKQALDIFEGEILSSGDSNYEDAVFDVLEPTNAMDLRSEVAEENRSIVQEAHENPKHSSIWDLYSEQGVSSAADSDVVIEDVSPVAEDTALVEIEETPDLIDLYAEISSPDNIQDESMNDDSSNNDSQQRCTEGNKNAEIEGEQKQEVQMFWKNRKKKKILL